MFTTKFSQKFDILNNNIMKCCIPSAEVWRKSKEQMQGTGVMSRIKDL